MRKNIIITGFMGTGKSVVAKELARKLGLKFIDMDRIIEERRGMSIADIFSRYGENYFREQENKLAKELSHKENVVIATGGGTMVYLENIKYLTKNGLIVCLWCDPQAINERLKKEKHCRPLFGDDDILANIHLLLNGRKKIYEDYILKINTTNLSIQEVANKILILVMDKNRW